MKTLEQLAREAGGSMLRGGEWSLLGNDTIARFRAACRAEALEEAAQRCEQLQEDGYTEVELGGEMPDAVDCAAAIREMK